LNLLPQEVLNIFGQSNGHEKRIPLGGGGEKANDEDESGEGALRVAGGAPTFLSACSQVAPARPHDPADKNVGAPPATRECARAGNLERLQ
jgi:hypothetical protein